MSQQIENCLLLLQTLDTNGLFSAFQDVQQKQQQ